MVVSGVCRQQVGKKNNKTQTHICKMYSTISWLETEWQILSAEHMWSCQRIRDEIQRWINIKYSVVRLMLLFDRLASHYQRRTRTHGGTDWHKTATIFTIYRRRRTLHVLLQSTRTRHRHIHDIYISIINRIYCFHSTKYTNNNSLVTHFFRLRIMCHSA